MSDKQAAAAWALSIVSSSTLILDTETTGLKEGEIAQIAVIDIQGNTLIDTLVNPMRGIPLDAQRIHGITNEMVQNAPRWNEVAQTLQHLLVDYSPCDLVVYNAQYDRRMMHQSNEVLGLPKIAWATLATWHCAMEAYAAFYGDWNEYHRSYRWQTLTNACYQQEIPEPEAPAHSAIGDCLRTLALIRKMSEYTGE